MEAKEKHIRIQFQIRSLCRMAVICFMILTLLPFYITVPDVQADTAQTVQNSPAENGSAPRKKVRVGYVLSRNFMEGDASAKSGFAYDYLQNVSYYTNWEYEYIYGSWPEMLQKLRDGDIDVLAGVSRKMDRDDELLFPDDPMGMSEYYIYLPETSGKEKDDPNALRGMSVGVNRDSVMEEELREYNERNHMNFNIITYADGQQRIRAFEDGRTEATVSADILLSPDSTDVPAAHIGGAEYYLAVSGKRSDLLDQLNQALVEMHSSEPDFPQREEEKYFGRISVGKNVTEKESAWLGRHKVITVGYSDGYEPFCYTDDNGRTDGVLPDLLRGIFTSQSPEVSLQFKAYQSYEKMLSDLRKGRLDIVMPILDQNNVSEQDRIYQTRSAIEVHMQMVYRGSYREARKGKLAVTRRNQSQTSYTSYYYPDNPKVRVDTLNGGLNAIKSGRADGMIINSYASNILLRGRSGFKSTPLVQSVGLCFGVRRGNSTLISILNRGIVRYGEEKVETSLVRNTEKTYHVTLMDFLRQNLTAVIFAGFLLAILILIFVFRLIYKRRENRLFDYMAHYDSMTMLRNRRSYDEAVSALRKDLPDNTVLVAADINGLKQVNDTLGHGAGDELIRGAARCLSESFGFSEGHESLYGALHRKKRKKRKVSGCAGGNMEKGGIFRTGGDEFVVILFAEPDEAGRMMETLERNTAGWKGMSGTELSLSTGTAIAADHPDADIDGLRGYADKEMYRSKKKYYEDPARSRRRS